MFKKLPPLVWAALFGLALVGSTVAARQKMRPPTAAGPVFPCPPPATSCLE